MIHGLNYAWRLAATGGCFAAFGLGGLVLSALFLPVMLIDRRGRAGPARWLIHKGFGLFMNLMEWVGIMRFDVVGAEKLRHCRNTLILANHPTLIDYVALVALMPNATCVVKQALWRNPMLGGIVRAARYISNSRPQALLDACTAELKAGNPLIIFPEGTRSRPGRKMRFLRGAADVALSSGMPVLPVLIACTPSTLSKRERWYQIPSRRFHLRIEVLDPVPSSHWVAPDERPELAARRMTLALQRYFTVELQRRAAAGPVVKAVSAPPD